MRVSLDRSTGQITRIGRSVHGLTQTTFALERLHEAKLGVSYDCNGNTCRTELHLTDPEETASFTNC